MRRWAILNAILTFCLLAILGGLWQTWTRALPEVEAAEDSGGAVPTGSGEGKGKGKGKRNAAQIDKAAQATPTAIVTAIVEKDLFDASRRPEPPKAVETSAPAPKQPCVVPAGVTVVGVAKVGKEREAFITDASQGAGQRRVRTGDAVVGYTVKTIKEATVIFTCPSGDTVDVSLMLEKGKGAGFPGMPGVPGLPVPPPPPRPPGGVRGRQGQPQQPGAPGGGSPAAGVQGGSPAAGIPLKPPLPVPPPPPPVAPGVPGGQPPTPLQKLPNQARVDPSEFAYREPRLIARR